MTGRLKGLESTAERLYFLLKDKLKEGDAWLDYDKLADDLGMSRPTVSNNMRKLKEAGYVEVRNGRLHLNSS